MSLARQASPVLGRLGSRGGGGTEKGYIYERMYKEPGT